MSDFLDWLWARPVIEGTLDSIPSVQGFYLIFDKNGDLIYVGKGDLNSRVNVHCNRNAPAGDYFKDAHSWRYFSTWNEDLALTCEQAVYDAYLKRTGKPPKHNERRPEGSSVPLQKAGEVIQRGVQGSF